MLKTLIHGPKLDNLLLMADRVRRVPGCIVEFGVYHGGTLQLLAERFPDRQCFGFDTWEGLPAESWTEGEPHGIGDFRDCDFEAVRDGMPANVELRRGRFPETAAGIDGPIALAHVDFDWERSTADAIEWLRPRLAPGGIAVFDDYEWKHCPGVKAAIERAGIPVLQSTNHQVYWVNA